MKVYAVFCSQLETQEGATMTKILCKADYEEATAATRDERMAW